MKVRIDKTLNILKKLKMNRKYQTVIKDAILPLFKQSSLIAKSYSIDIPSSNN